MKKILSLILVGSIASIGLLEAVESKKTHATSHKKSAQNKNKKTDKTVASHEDHKKPHAKSGKGHPNRKTHTGQHRTVARHTPIRREAVTAGALGGGAIARNQGLNPMRKDHNLVVNRKLRHQHAFFQHETYNGHTWKWWWNNNPDIFWAQFPQAFYAKYQFNAPLVDEYNVGHGTHYGK